MPNVNEATAAAGNVLQDVAGTQVIMVEIVIYCFASLLILALMNWYAAKRIGNRRSMGYQVLKVPRFVSVAIICGFTVVIGILCMIIKLEVTRRTLTYFGVPYFIALAYYLMQMLRRVKAETKGRRL